MNSYDEEKIPQILNNSRVVAIVGISDKPDRDSFRVGKYLKEAGYEILPVNPVIDSWDGQQVFKSLQEIPQGKRVDIVDIFRRSDAVYPIVEEALQLKPSTIWLQEGVVNEEAADLANSKGIQVIMDRCMMKEHRQLH